MGSAKYYWPGLSLDVWQYVIFIIVCIVVNVLFTIAQSTQSNGSDCALHAIANSMNCQKQRYERKK